MITNFIKKGKFLFRIALSVAAFTFGIVIFFTSETNEMKMVGFGLVTSILGIWVGTGSTKLGDEEIKDLENMSDLDAMEQGVNDPSIDAVDSNVVDSINNMVDNINGVMELTTLLKPSNNQNISDENSI